jgi:hypothetical protein
MVMDILGHSQIAMTMNTYAHVIPAMRQEAGRMDAALGSREGPGRTGANSPGCCQRC